MLDLKTIRRLIIASCPNARTEWVSVDKAVGRVLAKEIVAHRDVPEYEVSACDGIAVQWDAMKKGFFDFSVNQIASASGIRLKIESIDEGIEIKKGALIPENADTIIPRSGYTVEGEGFFRSAHVLATQHIKGQNILKKGQHCSLGSVLIPAHTKISPTHLASLSYSDASQLTVFKKPKIALITDTFLKENSGFQSSAYVPVFVELFKNLGADIELFSSHNSDEMPSKWLKRVFSMSDGVILLRTSERQKLDPITSKIIDAGVKSFADGSKVQACQGFWFGLFDNKIPFWDIAPGLYEQLLQSVLFIKPWIEHLLSIQSFKTYANISIELDKAYAVDFLPAKLVSWEGSTMAQIVGMTDFDLFTEQATGFVDIRNVGSKEELVPFISIL